MSMPRMAAAATSRAAPSHRIASSLLAPIVQAASVLVAQRPRQERLSGLHNPFGRAVALVDCWKFLDVCESADVLDPVEAAIGADIVLWDSELYLDPRAWDLARAAEGRHWPADPLAGAVVDIALRTGVASILDVRAAAAMSAAEPGAHYVIRYMPATSRYNRDSRFEPNRLAMEERPLVNHTNRPIWLVRGEDRAGSDFATGFAPVAPGWAARTQPAISKT